MSNEEWVALPGSELQVPVGHKRLGDVAASTEISISLYLRSRSLVDWVEAELMKPVARRTWLSSREWAAQHGALETDLTAVQLFASKYGLEIQEIDKARRCVTLKGEASALSAAFRVQEFGNYSGPSGAIYRGRSGPLGIPAGLAHSVTGVFGLENQPQAKAYVQLRQIYEPDSTYSPPELANIYGFPPATGRGQTIGLIELGGGFDGTDDLDPYFSGLSLSEPALYSVSVNGAYNAYNPFNGDDAEVQVDIEVAGSMANDARIVVYWSTPDEQGYIDAFSTAVHDSTYNPSVVSASWGWDEENWSAQGRAQLEQVFSDAAALGVTIVVASGDTGSAESPDGSSHVQFPASAPHALACGGTMIEIDRVFGKTLLKESVWSDNGFSSGGGVSVEFPTIPSYQRSVVPTHVTTTVSGRGVPDVAGVADGIKVRVDGEDQIGRGTSLAAPLWAALIARLNESLGVRLGFVNPQLYSLMGTSAFVDIVVGNNGRYSANQGWDACTGLGRPNGAALLKLLNDPGSAIWLGFLQMFGALASVETYTDISQFGQSYVRASQFGTDFLSGDADNGYWFFLGSTASPRVGFVKVRNTAGAIEVHCDSLVTRSTLTGVETSYERTLDASSEFSPSDDGDGVWQLFGEGGDPILGFVKWKNTAGTVEVSWSTLVDGAYTIAGQAPSDFSPSDAYNGVWQLFGWANNGPLLGFIKTRNTGGFVEVHWSGLIDGTYQRIGDAVSDFSAVDANNGVWQLFGWANGAPQLGFIKLRDMPDWIEVHRATFTGVSYQRSADLVSDFPPSQSDNGVWQVVWM